MNNSSAASAPSAGLGLATMAWSVAYGTVAVMAIFGNSMVIMAFVRNAKLHTRTNYFVVGLASADLLVGVLVVPLYISNMLLYKRKLAIPSALNSVYLVTDIFGGFASIFHLMLISLERFYAIVCPVSHRNSSRWMYIVSLAVVWVVSGSLSVIHALREGSSSKEAFMILIVVCFGVAFLVICAAYVGIWRKARKRRRKHSTSLASKRKRRKQDQDVTIAITVLMVIVLFIVTWLPFVCINVLYFFKVLATNIKVDVILFAKLLHYSNSAINPIIYSLKIPGFKKTFTSLLRRESQRSMSRSHSFSRRDSRMKTPALAGLTNGPV